MSARPAPPSLLSHPLLAPSLLIALLLPLETGQMVYHVRQKHIVVRAWPRTNAIPDRSPTSTYGPCPNYDCTSRSARSKSFPPLRRAGLRRARHCAI